MFVLVFILFHSGAYKVSIDPKVYKTWDQCQTVAESSYEQLMKSRPKESSYVLTHCLQIPRGV